MTVHFSRTFRGLSWVAIAACLLVCDRMVFAQPPSPEQSAIDAVTAFTEAVVKADATKLSSLCVDNAMLVGPSSLQPVSSKAAILQFYKDQPPKEKTTYFHLRQPTANVLWQSAIVIANYEAGAQEDGKLVETNGKVLVVLAGETGSWKVGARILVPNANAGTYGPMGTSISARPWGMFPQKAIPLPDDNKPPMLATATEKELYELTKQINATFPKGDVDKMLKFADDKVSFWAGDYGPVYLQGTTQARQHFADFFSTGKMHEIRMFRPEIRVYGGIGVVYFQFEETLEVYSKLIRSPGQATYSFRVPASGAPRLAACTETALVKSAIGDPYPQQR